MSADEQPPGTPRPAPRHAGPAGDPAVGAAAPRRVSSHTAGGRRRAEAPRSAHSTGGVSRFGRWATALVSVFCLVISGFGWTVVYGLDLSSAEGLEVGTEVHDGARDILLVGTDNRTDAQGNALTQEETDMLRAGDDEGAENTDTILLIRVPEDGSSATAISVPRDTYVSTPLLGNVKINGVLGLTSERTMERELARGATEAQAASVAEQAGRNALIEAISDLTGVEVDHYAEIGLLGFVLMTDAVGGVDVCLLNDVNEPLSGADFHQGEQTINGADALSFVRQRHQLPAGDLDRIVRQQVFMSQLVNQVLSAGTLTDPSKLNDLVNAAQRSFVIDESWDYVDFVMRLGDISGGSVRFETIPVRDIDAIGDYGESVIEVDKAAVHHFVGQFASGADEDDDEDEDDAADGAGSGTDGAGSADATEGTEGTEGTGATNATSDNGAAAPNTTGPGDIEPAPGFDPTMFTIDIVNTTDQNGFADSVMQALAEEGFTQGELITDPMGAFNSYVVASSAHEVEARYVSDLLGGLPTQLDDTLALDTIRVVLTEDYDGPRYSLDPELALERQAEAATETAAESLPPEIAQRPTFDAGGSDVPCVN